jgi:hypothetical protein
VQSALQPHSDGRCATEYRTIGIEDGITRWITACGRVLFDAERQPVRFVGVTRDTGENKSLEDRFRQAQKLESIGWPAAWPTISITF